MAQAAQLCAGDLELPCLLGLEPDRDGLAGDHILFHTHDRKKKTVNDILGKKIDELVRFGLPADKVFECLDENQRILSVVIQLRENGLSNEKFEEWHECHYKEPQRYSS